MERIKIPETGERKSALLQEIDPKTAGSHVIREDGIRRKPGRNYKMARGSLLALLAALGLFYLTGCATVIYQELNADLTAHAGIDRNNPTTTTLWTYAWGNFPTEWTPSDPDFRLPLCYNKGAGRVEVRYKWYSALLTVATLGIAVPMEVKIFCYVDPRTVAVDSTDTGSALMTPR